MYLNQEYVQGQIFTGGTEINFSGTAQLDQQGAFVLSQPQHVGKEAIVPYGIEYNASAGTIAADVAPEQTMPTLQALEPWHVVNKIYVGGTEFWSPDTL